MPEYLGESLFGSRLGFLNAHAGVEFTRTMIKHWIGFGQFVALAFLGNHMQELQTAQLFQVFQRRHQGVQIVTIDRTNVIETQFLAQRGWRHHRSEEHTSELQSLMRISYAVFCCKKKKQTKNK